MEQWEYIIKELTTWHRLGKTKDGRMSEMITFDDLRKTEVRGLFGKKTKEKRTNLTAEELGLIFNNLGTQGWELCGVAPLTITSSIGAGSNTDRAYFIFKRQKHQ